MLKSPIRVLVVEDFKPWGHLYRSMFQKQPEFQIIGEVSDGLEAVHQARQLQPDLILLDIGLPTLNGIEAARRIKEVCAASKILFVSENRSAAIVEEALGTGAGGYVVKADAGRELLSAVKAVIQGERFVSASVFDRDSPLPMNHHAAAIRHRHEVAFYADDASVIDGYARFIESSLESGHVVILVVNKSHRASLIQRLKADGVDLPAAAEQGRYIPLDAADTLSQLTVNNMPDPVRCSRVVGDLITGAAKKVEGDNGRVVVCGEIAPTLLSKGNVEGAIRLESLWDEITRGYGVHTLCGYLWDALPGGKSSPVFDRVCGEHSAIHREE